MAATAHAPILAAASPKLLGLQSFVDLPQPRDLSATLNEPQYAAWRSFRDSSDSRYVGLTLPHILLRRPYGPATNPIEAFNFVEEEVSGNQGQYLWGNAAYALGSCLTNAFAKYSWCAAIRGVEGGGLVECLPTHTFQTDEGEIALKCPTEIAITDRREKELSDLGFIPLVHCKGLDYAAFFGMQSCQKPGKFDSEVANANSRLAGQLQYVLTTSRFAHYIKTMMRDKIGSFLSRGDCEQFLNRWISRYVTSSDDVGLAQKAQFPLQEARIEVAEIPGKPGTYKAVCFLRPHFQLDELTISLRLVVELPPPVGT
jgi:type VI secretion system protein ImpC